MDENELGAKERCQQTSKEALFVSLVLILSVVGSTLSRSSILVPLLPLFLYSSLM